MRFIVEYITSNGHNGELPVVADSRDDAVQRVKDRYSDTFIDVIGVRLDMPHSLEPLHEQEDAEESREPPGKKDMSLRDTLGRIATLMERMTVLQAQMCASQKDILKLFSTLSGQRQ